MIALYFYILLHYLAVNHSKIALANKKLHRVGRFCRQPTPRTKLLKALPSCCAWILAQRQCHLWHISKVRKMQMKDLYSDGKISMFVFHSRIITSWYQLLLYPCSQRSIFVFIKPKSLLNYEIAITKRTRHPSVCTDFFRHSFNWWLVESRQSCWVYIFAPKFWEGVGDNEWYFLILWLGSLFRLCAGRNVCTVIGKWSKQLNDYEHHHIKQHIQHQSVQSTQGLKIMFIKYPPPPHTPLRTKGSDQFKNHS